MTAGAATIPAPHERSETTADGRGRGRREAGSELAIARTVDSTRTAHIGSAVTQASTRSGRPADSAVTTTAVPTESGPTSEGRGFDFDESIGAEEASDALPVPAPDRLATLMVFLGDDNEFASVYVRQHDSIRLSPWTGDNTGDSDRLVFESEIGFPAEQIEAIARPDGLAVVAAISADPNIAVERVLSASPWADVATVEQVGQFQLISFGTAVDLDFKSLIRPIGQPGEMAFTDGFMVWSPELGEVRDLIEREPTQRFSEIATAVAQLGSWTELTVYPARSVDSFLDCESCDPVAIDSERASMTQFGNPAPFRSSTVVQTQGSDEFVVLVEHTTIELAATNVNRLPLVFDRAIDFATQRPMTDDFDLRHSDQEGSFVVLNMTKKLPGAADVLWLSTLLTWDE